MKRIIVVVGVLVLAIATPAFAHRLDEYLEAATISVAKDRVVVEMRLAPGVAVVPRILKLVDADGDGVLSDPEQRAYAERVSGDLSLSVDGERVPLHVASFSYPTVDELRRGIGEIHLTLDAALSPGRSAHRLVFENTHESAVAAYLVNALVPEDPQIKIIEQTRDYRQSSYRLDYAEIAGRSVSIDVVLEILLLASGVVAAAIQLCASRRGVRREHQLRDA